MSPQTTLAYSAYITLPSSAIHRGRNHAGPRGQQEPEPPPHSFGTGIENKNRKKEEK